MRERKPAGRGGRRRSGGESEPDLFAQHLAAVVEQAFVTGGTAPPGSAPPGGAPPEAPVEVTGGIGTEVPVREAEAPAAAPFEAQAEALPAEPLQARAESPAEPPHAPAAEPAEPLPARMLNEFVYCPRLFYYEHVEGVFVESADTIKGAAVHKRVDKGKGALPPAKAPPAEGGAAAAPPAPEQEEIHSRSVMLGSERLGVVAKMDLVEATLGSDGRVAAVCPVDYKVGAPREGAAGLELWDADRMQLGLQCLVLRENGYACETGIIYYRKTKQRVPLALTPELEAWVLAQIAAARVCARGAHPGAAGGFAQMRALLAGASVSAG